MKKLKKNQTKSEETVSKKSSAKASLKKSDSAKKGTGKTAEKLSKKTGTKQEDLKVSTKSVKSNKKAETKSEKPSKNVKANAKAGQKKTMSQKSKTLTLDKKEQAQLVKIANAMLKDNLSIRQAVDKFDVPRATLHKRIHNQLPLIDAKLYDKLSAKLGKRSSKETA